jgi:protein-S-isoprenylcysteine O-methyltransferase Ste14
LDEGTGHLIQECKRTLAVSPASIAGMKKGGAAELVPLREGFTSTERRHFMKRCLFLLYGVACYLSFMAIYAYMAGFVGNFLVPKTIDAPADNSFLAVGINLLLIALFGLQHSIMARPLFKRYWTRMVPPPIERSTYVLVSCLVTIVLMWQWRAVDYTIWTVEQPLARAVLWGLFALGWLMVPGTSLMINHSDLFGVRQVWLHWQGRPYTALSFRTPLLYNRVRHPLYLGWALAFWAIPTMTLGHLIFAGSLTLYMAVAAHIEERDLIGFFGEDYRAYRRRVPMFMPRLSRTADSR